ncbi:MAG: ABC transporter ATP-binding protein [Thermoplasmatota archaeon]
MVSALRTVGLRKRYKDVEALKGIDLEVKRGEVFGFLGPNGAGKTTFTKCVTGFVRPDAGQIEVLGVDARAESVRVNRYLGLVPDQYDFYPNLTGRQHLDFYGRLNGMSAGKRRSRIDEVLTLVKMHERADSRTKEYSHGMKQRICIAQALLHEPAIVILDEPTNGLDPQGAYELREMIRGLAKDGTTIFLNSHQLHEVEQTCDRVAILQRGRLRALNRIDELKRMASAGAAGTAAGVRLRLLNPTKGRFDVARKVLGEAPTTDGNQLLFNADDEQTAAVVAALAAAGGRIAEVQRQEAGLESIFLQLTGQDDEVQA